MLSILLVIKFLRGTESWSECPDVFFPARSSHGKKYGWLTRLASLLGLYSLYWFVRYSGVHMRTCVIARMELATKAY